MRSVATRLELWLWQGPGFEVAQTLGQALPREKISALQLSLDPIGRFRLDKVTLDPQSSCLRRKRPRSQSFVMRRASRSRAASALYLNSQRTWIVLDLLWSLPGQKQGDYTQLVTPIQELKHQ